MANVNKIRTFEPVTMELGGKVRTLRFDMNAYAELENKFGSIDDAMKQLQNGRMKDIRMILWIGLIHEEAIVDEESGEPTGYNITPYQVGSWIKNAKMLTDASTKLAAAMQEGMPEEELEEAKTPEAEETKNA